MENKRIVISGEFAFAHDGEWTAVNTRLNKCLTMKLLCNILLQI